MVPVRVVAVMLSFLVVAECQRGSKNYPQSPFLKGGQRRDLAQSHSQNHNNWNRWPGFGSDKVDGHSDNHSHGRSSHTHTLGIKMPRGNGKGIGGNCGGQQYAGRTHMCCGGAVKRRQGMRPACCGTEVFDFVFDLCCNGVITKRTVSRPVC